MVTNGCKAKSTFPILDKDDGVWLMTGKFEHTKLGAGVMMGDLIDNAEWS